MTDPMKTASERLDELLGPETKVSMKYDLKVALGNGNVLLTTMLDGRHMLDEIIDVSNGLKDKAVREALIALGWTPPKDEP